MKLYQFLANGFEECEALATVDICRRAGIDVTVVSVTGDTVVESAHKVGIVADVLFEQCDFTDADVLMLPGGMPGATNLLAHNGLCNVLLSHFRSGKLLAAICAAPLVLGNLGLLEGLRATCYPGFEGELLGAIPTGALVEQDGQMITGKGPGAAYELGFAIVERMCGKSLADTLRKGMICNG